MLFGHFRVTSVYENPVLIEADSSMFRIRTVSELLGTDFSVARGYQYNDHTNFRLCSIQRRGRRHCRKNLICAVKGASCRREVREISGHAGRLRPLDLQWSLSLLPEYSESFAVDHLCTMLNGFNISQNDGGDYNIALAYMASWKGPVYGGGRTLMGTMRRMKSLKPCVIFRRLSILVPKIMIPLKKLF